jgi:hypothetical protein
MKSSQLNKSRFIVGIVLVVIAVLMFLFAKPAFDIERMFEIVAL